MLRWMPHLDYERLESLLQQLDNYENKYFRCQIDDVGVVLNYMSFHESGHNSDEI